MPGRPAKFASTVFVTILASAPLLTTARGEPATADGCLSSPQGDTPPGAHWRYRVDHINKRNCWYLRREDGRVQALPQDSAPAPIPAPPAPAKPSIADARAEFRGRPANTDSTAASPPASSAAADTGTANTSVWNATPTVATRWPELPPAFQMPKADPAAASPASNVAQAPADPLQAGARPAPFAYLLLPMRSETLLTLIAATLGALAFVGAASLISRRYRQRRVRRRKATAARGPIWETTDDDRIVLSDYPATDDRDYRPRFARGAAGATSRPRVPESVQRTPRRARR